MALNDDTAPVPVPVPVPSVDEEARRNRITSHMNKAHTRELGHSLRHYAGISARAAARPSMRDLTLDGMLIRAEGIDYEIPFSPPLTAWDDVRPRVVAMDAEARRHLGISDILLPRHYLFPWPFHCLMLGGVVFFFGCVATLPYVTPARPAIWRAVDTVFPGGAPGYRWLVRSLLFPVIGIHLVETFFLERKIKKHGVERWSALWWLWLSICFFEGFGAFARVNDYVAKKRAEKSKKSH